MRRTKAQVKAQASRRILFVHSDKEFFRELSELLPHDVEIIHARNGSEAMQKFYRFKGEFSAVLASLIVPRIDGFSLITRLRKLSPIPFIILAKSDASRMDKEFFGHYQIYDFPREENLQEIRAALGKFVDLIEDDREGYAKASG